MRFFSAVLAFLICAAIANADERIKLNVRISQAPEGVAAHFEIARDVTNLRLEYRSEFAEGTWAITTPGLTYKNGEVSSATPFHTFDVVVTARNDFVSGPFYPCVIKIGDSGRIVYASYFAGLQSAYDTTISFETPSSTTAIGLPRGGSSFRVERTAAPSDQAAGIYVYLGPASAAKETPLATYIADPAVQPWIQQQLENLASPSLAFYRRNIGISLRRKPLIMTTFSSGRKGAFQADVTEGPNVVFRIFGDQWREKTDRATADIRHTARHEYAHFWNSYAVRSSDNEGGRWLHEGGAEYWARLAEADLDRNERHSSNVESALNKCAANLVALPLSRTTAAASYPCGETIQWFADLGQRRSGKDYFSLWRELLKRADANGGNYSVAMFRELAERNTPTVRDTISLIVDRDGTDRWYELPAILAKLRVKLEAAPPEPAAFRDAVVMHVIEGNCGNGFWIEDGWLKLETEENCGPLSGKPQVDSMNGHNLFTDPKGAFDAVEAACKSNGDVTFSRAGVERTWTVKCDRPLHKPPPTFAYKLKP
ncbi:MAG: hypothetical protein HOP13_16760 [Alphaproteobacteria bacterium]|nr:hypothetical protein [Alphaproteobacteria bacterium]